MSQESFLKAFTGILTHRDWEGAEVEVVKNKVLRIKKYPEKMSLSQSITSINQRAAMVYQGLTLLLKEHDLSLRIEPNQSEIELLKKSVNSNPYRLFFFQSTVIISSRCSFTVTTYFLKQCRDYLHIDWRRAFTADLLRFEGQTLTLFSDNGQLRYGKNDQGERIMFEKQTFHALMYIMNKHCDTHYWYDSYSLPVEVCLTMEQGAKRQFESLILPLEEMAEVKRLYRQSQFNIELSLFCKAIISATRCIPSFNSFEELRLDRNKDQAIHIINTALDIISWDQSMLANDLKKAVRLYQAWVELLAKKLSEYLDVYHGESLDKSLFNLAHYSQPKKKNN